jgi:hypothetical protein
MLARLALVSSRPRFDPWWSRTGARCRRYRRRVCSRCGQTGRRVHHHDRRRKPWRHLDLGSTRWVIECELRRVWCPDCGAQFDAVPWARPGSRYTRDFEDTVAWLAQQMAKTAIAGLLRIGWDSVGRIVQRVVADHLDDRRLSDLVAIGCDEISYRRGQRYLTSVVDHRAGAIVWCAPLGYAGISMALTPLPDVVDEARRLIGEAAERDVPIWLIGGLAVRIASSAAAHPALVRPYKDIDLVTMRGASRRVIEYMDAMGYIAHSEFNTLNGHKRLLFFDEPHQRQVDVFVGVFEMCHTIPITNRLAAHPVTVPLAELLLTKLQVVELNEKDLRDVLALILGYVVSEDQRGGIDFDYVAALCAADWGLWRTVRVNLERVSDGVTDYALSAGEQELVRQRVAELWARIEAEPKSMKWRLRDRVGDRRRWYVEPEEVG